MKKKFSISPKISCFLHGADYNPEQWIDSPKIWQEDMRLMKLAECNTAVIGIFSWVMYEPEEGKFSFEWMDRVMDMLAENKIFAILATPSGAKPAWMSHKYPEIRRKNREGIRDPHETRHNHCYTSPVYREKSIKINSLLAERYKDHPSLLLWHVSNEYGGTCYCELCFKAYREWLKKKYLNLEELNKAWWSSFWSHKFTEWDQISSIDESIHGMSLDWKRFVTHQTLDFFKAESGPLRQITPDVPVTVNMMGLYPELDYWKMAPFVDVISWDNYPAWHSGNDIDTAITAAFTHDINRSMKQGQPFLLMESTPSNTNWQPVGKRKRPGMHVLSSLQAIAHGSDSVQYFQWRKSRGSAEKFHGAVVDHAGHENTREFRDVAKVGTALKRITETLSTSVRTEAALIYDWENRWAIEQTAGPRNTEKLYTETCIDHYSVFWENGTAVDVINMDQDLSKYKLVCAPMLYMIRPGVADRIIRFVEQGGIFVTTYLSGIADENDLCFLGGFPGPLKELLGIWAEETDVFYHDNEQSIRALKKASSGLKGPYPVKHYADVIYNQGAEVLAVYEREFYAGTPALTVKNTGKGKAYYIASRNGTEFLRDFYKPVLTGLGIRNGLLKSLPKGISVQERGECFFIMNFNNSEVKAELTGGGYKNILTDQPIKKNIKLMPYGIAVLKPESRQAEHPTRKHKGKT